jgi:Chaperone of endosialidase
MQLERFDSATVRASFRQRNSRRLGFACACATLIAAVLAAPTVAASAGPAGHGSMAGSRREKSTSKKGLTRQQKRQIVALIKRYAGTGPQGPAGEQGLAGPPGPAGTNAIAGPPTGPAGGALSGSYPNPSLNVSGGPGPNGQALVDVSSLAALSCAAGVYADEEENTAAGFNSLHSHTEGCCNAAFGVYAMEQNTVGSGNTAIGGGALREGASGSLNTAIGNAAGYTLTTGVKNTMVGESAGFGRTSGENDIYVGTPTTEGEESNTIRIGKTFEDPVHGLHKHTRAFLAGVSETNIGANPAVVVNGEGQLGVETSSRRFKTDIHPLSSQMDRLMELRPVSFRYKHADVNGPSRVQYGLLAEQVARVFPNLVVRGRDGRPYTVLYQELPALLLAQAQRQRGQIARQRRQVRALRARLRGVDRLRAQVRWLMRRAR